LILAGSRIRTEHHFRSHFRPNDSESAKALESRVKSYLQLYQAGLLDKEAVRQRLNLD